MKRVSWSGVVVIASSTILSWLAGMPRVSPPQTGTPLATAGTAGPEARALAVTGLHDWTVRQPRPSGPSRDIFAFGHQIAPPAPPAPSLPLFQTQTKGPNGSSIPMTALFKLIGFAEDEGPEGALRTAIISGQGQLYMVKEGDTVAVLYRVAAIEVDAVELIDTMGGPRVRLTMK